MTPQVEFCIKVALIALAIPVFWFFRWCPMFETFGKRRRK